MKRREEEMCLLRARCPSTPVSGGHCCSPTRKVSFPSHGIPINPVTCSLGKERQLGLSLGSALLRWESKAARLHHTPTGTV